MWRSSLATLRSTKSCYNFMENTETTRSGVASQAQRVSRVLVVIAQRDLNSKTHLWSCRPWPTRRGQDSEVTQALSVQSCLLAMERCPKSATRQWWAHQPSLAAQLSQSSMILNPTRPADATRWSVWRALRRLWARSRRGTVFHLAVAMHRLPLWILIIHRGRRKLKRSLLNSTFSCWKSVKKKKRWSTR